MFDRMALALSKPLVDFAARHVAKRGISADQVTLACFALGMASALLIAVGHERIALIPMLAGRAVSYTHLTLPTKRIV